VGYNATYVAQTTLTGPGLGAGSAPYVVDSSQTAPPNSNAPPPTSFELAVGANTITLPTSGAGFAFTRVQVMPPASSTNAKYLTTSAPARVIPSASANYWTTGSITLPAGPGDTIYLNSAGIEALLLVFS
jgi:hypothetical protein